MASAESKLLTINTKLCDEEKDYTSKKRVKGKNVRKQRHY